MDAIITAGKAVPAESNRPDQRPKGDLKHSKVQSGQPDTKCADEQSCKRCNDGACDKAGPHRQGSLGQHKGNGIGPNTVKGPMMKLKQSTMAHDHIETHGQ
jgi:hypothetical protein